MTKKTEKEDTAEMAGARKATKPKGGEKTSGAKRTAESAPKRLVQKTGGRKAASKGGTKKPGPRKASASRAGLRERAEEVLKKQAYRLESLYGQDKDEIIHNLGTYQIELEMQNEALRRAQANLAVSQKRLVELHDLAPVGYFTLAPKGTITSVNLTGASMLGKPRGALLHKPFAAFLHEDERDKFHLYIRKTLQEEGRQDSDFRLNDRKANGTMHVRLESVPNRNDVGEVLEIWAIVSDITARKESEGRLQEKMALLSAIIDNTDVMLAYLDRDFNFVWVNPTYAGSCRMEVEDMAGRNHFDLFPGEENEVIFRKVRDTGEPVFFKDKPFTYPDQSQRGVTYWDWSLVPVKDNDGLVQGLVFSLRETTTFKRTQLALAASEERFRTITETSMDIIFQVDQNSRIIYVSPSSRALGYNLEQVRGRSFEEFLVAEYIPKVEAAFQRILQGEKIHLFDFRLHNSKGEIVDCEINANPMFREEMVVGIQGTARDVTERNLAEEQIRQIARFPAENPFPVMRIKRDGVILYANKAGIPLLDYWESKIGDLLPEEICRLVKDAASTGIIREIEQSCGDRILALSLVPILEGDFVNIYGFDITDRKCTEAKIQLRNALLNCINVVFLAGMQCETDEDLAGETLRVAEQLTNSSFGYIGEIGPDGLLHDMAASVPGWKQKGITDLCNKVLSEGKPLIVNNPAAPMASCGSLPEHSSFSAFMGVPLLYRGKVIGLFALGNREGEYHREQLEAIRSLAPVFIETLFKCRTERALLESEERERGNAAQFKQFVNFTPIPVFIAHDPECRFITANQAGARLLGVAPDVNLSQTPWPGEKTPSVVYIRNGRQVVPEEMPLQYAVRRGARVENVELGMVVADGSVRRMLGAATPLFDEAGRIQGGIAAYIDITDRKRMEEQLQQAKQEWEMTFDAVPDLIAVLDKGHRIVRANRAMAKRLNLEPEDLVGQHCFACCHGTTGPAQNCPHAKTVRDGREHRAELLEERLGGYYLVTTTPLLDKQGNFIRSIHVARDITEQKKAEQEITNLNDELRRSLLQLEITNENLQRSNEDLQHFASIVSHDLQEPLRTISSFVQLIARRYEDRLDEKGYTFMQHIVDGTNHMQRLLNDLLSYSRVGGGRLARKTVSLESVLKDIKRKLDKRIKENRAEIISSGLPDVYGDEMQIFTLLQNLISNALKYRGPDPPRVQVTAVQKDGNEWIICMRDNGIGFNPKHAEQIFLIFQRLHLRHEYEGTGIGLAVCKKIVERHGGRIWAESEPGLGSTFCFSLPEPDEGAYE